MTQISGYMGSVSSSRGDQEGCTLHRAIWTTQCWEEVDNPQVGSVLALAGSEGWYVTRVDRAGCGLVLQLCRATIACPDCLATIYSLERTMNLPETCDQTLDPVQIAAGIPATICPVESTVEVFGDAEISNQRVLICLEGVADIQPQMIVACATNYYRVVAVRQRCSSACLTTVEAELDRLGLMNA